MAEIIVPGDDVICYFWVYVAIRHKKIVILYLCSDCRI